MDFAAFFGLSRPAIPGQDRIALAKYMAERAHMNQVRKWTGEPYIVHPARVAASLPVLVPGAPTEMAIAAWLHDVVEDSDVTQAEVEETFGAMVGLLVYELTKPNEIRTAAAASIKCLDLIDNLGNLADVAPPAEAISYLLKKAPQVLDLGEKLKGAYPDMVEAMLRAWWRNWEKLKFPEVD